MQPPDAVRAVHLPGHRRGEHIRVRRVLFMLLHQQVHRLFGQADRPHRIGGFRLGDPHLTLQAPRRFRHRQGSGLHIEVSPEQSRQLSPPQSRGQLQVEHGQDAVFLRRAEIGPDLLRRKDPHLLFLLRRQAAADGGVEGDEPLLHRLIQGGAEHGVEAPHRPGAQAPVLHPLVFLHPAALFGFVVELLKIQGGELLQLNFADVGRDMVLNVAAVVFGGGVLDSGLAIVLVPEPAPFLHRVLTGFSHINFAAFLNGPGQLLFALFLGFRQHVFVDGLARYWVSACRVTALPAAIGAFSQTALTVCSFLCRGHSPPVLISPSLSSMHSAIILMPSRKPRMKFSRAVMLSISCCDRTSLVRIVCPGSSRISSNCFSHRATRSTARFSSE